MPLLQALAGRNLERVLTRVGDEVVKLEHKNWLEAMSAAMGILVEAFRTEPGFRGLRVGDVIDLRPTPTDRTYKSILADRMLDGLIARFGYTDSPELRFLFESAVEVSDALASRAFLHDPNGEEQFLRVGYDVTYRMLAPYLGEIDPS